MAKDALYLDGFAYAYQRYGGINRIYDELVERLPAAGFPVYMHVPATVELAREPTARYNFPRPLCRQIVYWKMPRVWNLSSHRGFRRSGAPVFMGSYYNPRPKGCRRAFVVAYDMIHELHETGLVGNLNVAPTLARKRVALLGADRIIAISENTRRDLLKFYPEVDPGRVSVQYLSAGPEFTPDGPAETADEPYILFVGSRFYYKNFPALLSAYIRSTYLRTRLAFKVVNNVPWTYEEKIVIGEDKDRVQLLQGRSDEELARLYRGATAFVYPSLYEGFGIPIAEAMACGTPTVCARRGSMPEVGGDAAVYFDPDKPGDLTRALEEVCSDAALRERLRKAGPVQAARFQAGNFAEHVAELLGNG